MNEISIRYVNTGEVSQKHRFLEIWSENGAYCSC